MFHKIIYWFIILIVFSFPLYVGAFFLDDWFGDLEEYLDEESFESTATNSVQIINEINVSASTGGNVAGPGEVVEGEAEVKVEIENIINDQSIEPVDIEVESDKGEAQVEVEQEIIYPDEQGEISVEREIEINQQIETENYQNEIDKKDEEAGQPASIEQRLEESESLEEPENLEKLADSDKSKTEPKLFSKVNYKIYQWWFSFLGGLKTGLAKIISFWRN